MTQGSTNTTILIPCGNILGIDAIIAYALPISSAFNSSLTILAMGSKELLKDLQSAIQSKYKKDDSQNLFRFFQMNNSFKERAVMEKNHLDEEVIMVIFPELPSSYLSQRRFISRSRKLRLPFIVLPQSPSEKWTPQNVIMPISHSRSDKEAAIWVSYWARFNQSKIILLTAQDKEASATLNVNLNVRFIDKLFKNLNISCQIIEENWQSYRIGNAAVERAAELKNSLIAITTTKYYSVEHLFLSPRELRLIKNSSNVPIFCINPRKDLYLLCN